MLGYLNVCAYQLYSVVEWSWRLCSAVRRGHYLGPIVRWGHRLSSAIGQSCWLGYLPGLGYAQQSGTAIGHTLLMGRAIDWALQIEDTIC